ncbi:hypothetical protein ABPG74_009097 [Tetrahymena malaccensis]
MDVGSQQKDFMQIYHPNCLLDDRLKALINDIIPLFTQAEVLFQVYSIITCIQIINNILIDLNSLFKSIESEITFPMFKSLWKDYRLQFLTSCLHKKEDKKEFIQLFYGVLLNKLIQSNNFNVQTVCLMGIYTLFQTQSESDRERINLDIDSMQKLRTYFSNSLQKSQTQGADILKILFTKEAFIITQKRGIKTIILDKFGYPLKKNAFYEAENICGFSQIPQSMEIEIKEKNVQMSEDEDDDDDEDEDEDQMSNQQKTNYSDPEQLIEFLGINELKEASNEYFKQKNKKKEISKYFQKQKIKNKVIILVSKVAESDVPYYDQIKKNFIGKFSHDINQVDQFFASRTETRIQRQLNQNNLQNN